MRIARSLRPLALPVVTLLAVAGCASKVPLPPLPPLQPYTPIAAQPAPAASAPDLGIPPTTLDAAPPAETSPINIEPVPFSAGQPANPAAGAEPLPTPALPPYSDAVAARFPDPPVSLFTPAFESGHPGYTSNAELHSFLQGLSDRPATGTTVQLLNIGSSQRGQPLDALLFTRVPDSSPTSLLASGRPTVLLMAQQHGDEPAGAEALIVLAQRLAGPELQGLLDRINVIVLPRANPDGATSNRHETDGGIDLNTDHLLLRTPEAQAIASLMRDYKPMVVADAHEYAPVGPFLATFNAIAASDVMTQYAMTANLPPFVTKASEEWFRQPLVASLKREGFSNEWVYSTTADPVDKTLSMGSVQPDVTRNVDGLRNAVSLTIESRGVGLGRLHLKRRVLTQIVAMTSVLRSSANRAGDLVKLRAYVEAEVASKVCQGDAIVQADETPSEYRVTMLDPVTGADKVVSVSWNSALELTTVKRRPRPCGYWLSADAVNAVSKLRDLGATVQQLQEPGVVQADSFTETSRQVVERKDARAPGDPAAANMQVRVALKSALMDVPAGSYYVGLDQPLAALIMAAMEPDTPSSYVTGGLISSLGQQARVTLPPNLRIGALP